MGCLLVEEDGACGDGSRALNVTQSCLVDATLIGEIMEVNRLDVSAFDWTSVHAMLDFSVACN